MNNLKNCCNALSRAFTPRPARSEPGDNNAGGDAPDALSLPAPVRVHSAPLLALTSLASPPDEPGEQDVDRHDHQDRRDGVAAEREGDRARQECAHSKISIKGFS